MELKTYFWNVFFKLINVCMIWFEILKLGATIPYLCENF